MWNLLKEWEYGLFIDERQLRIKWLCPSKTIQFWTYFYDCTIVHKMSLHIRSSFKVLRNYQIPIFLQRSTENSQNRELKLKVLF